MRQVFRNVTDNNLNIGAMHVELYGTTSGKDFITRSFQANFGPESNWPEIGTLA